MSNDRYPLLLCTAREAIAARVAAMADLGPAALEVVDRRELPARIRADAVLLLDLPFGGPWDAGTIASLRCEPRCAENPILVIVDDGDDATPRDCLGAGADDYLRAGSLERDLGMRLAAQRRAFAIRSELRSRERDLRALVELTRSFAGNLEVGQLLPAVTRRLAQLLSLRRCSLVLTDAEGRVGTVIATSDAEVVRSPIDLSKYPEIREVLRTRRAVVVEDADRHPLLDPVKEALSAAGMGAMAVLPLALEEEVLGVLFLRASAEEGCRSFTVRELDFAAAVANATAVALRNARSVEEIRNRVEAVEAKARARKQYVEIYEHLAEGIALVEAHTGIVRSANPAALAILGRNAEEVRNRPVEEVLQPEDEAACRTLLLEAASGLVLRNVAIEARRSDGEPLHLEAGASRLDGNLVVLSLRDVTDRKRIERELAATREKLEEAARQAMIVELAGAAAHELNQPLTSVLGWAELLQRRLGDSDPASRSVGIILREAERMAEVVRKIGRITRHETKQYVGGARIVDLERAGEED